MGGDVKSSTTSSLPLGAGETMHVREDSDGNRGVGWTEERAQENLEKEQSKNDKDD